jgi:SpoVK/Ycf46/Vps4 family AAA+-type ATPase
MAAEPYTDVASHLRDELRRAWLRVEYQIRVGWSKGPSQVADEGTLVTPMDMGRLFALARGESTATDESGATALLAQWLDMHKLVEARLRATLDAKLASPLVDVMRAFDLTPRQWGTLMFAVLPEVDPNLVQAYRYLAHDSTCRGLDGRLLATLVYDTPKTRSLMARDLSATSPLLKYRLVDLVVPQGTVGDSLLFRRIRAATRIVYILDGAGVQLDPELGDVAELRSGDQPGWFPQVASDTARAAMRSSDVVLAVQGQRGVGKKLLLQQAAAHWKRSLLVIDCKRLAQYQVSSQHAIMRSIARELKLLDALPVFADVDDAVVFEGEKDGMPGYFSMLLDEWDGPVAITINRERMPRMHQRPLVHVTLEVPPLQIRTQLWRDIVPALSEPDAESLSGRFAIPGGIAVAAAQAAQAQRLDTGALTAGDLERAVAQQLHQRISRLGKKLPTPFGLDDLVVDDDTRAAIIEISAAARERRKIREQFKLRGAAGISVLFSGHPGVGKTMSGTVLAKRLGLDIYEIDLSQVVSKWLGETEKNLSDVFDAAEPGHVVLLFNEADTLFGKRTSNVQSSNDRYANMETNYLLQRLERFNGLAILTSNLASSIDQAFKRRFTYDVFFSFPAPDMRAELWRRTLPRTTGPIDLDVLAEKYELTGGFIKVACERAAYVAGAAQTEIDEELLHRTIERMYRERGKLSTVGPLE